MGGGGQVGKDDRYYVSIFAEHLLCPPPLPPSPICRISAHQQNVAMLAFTCQLSQTKYVLLLRPFIACFTIGFNSMGTGIKSNCIYMYNYFFLLTPIS